MPPTSSLEYFGALVAEQHVCCNISESPRDYIILDYIPQLQRNNNKQQKVAF
jgi:hypothetical protein